MNVDKSFYAVALTRCYGFICKWWDMNVDKSFFAVALTHCYGFIWDKCWWDCYECW